jgi:hypothetical protein
MGFPALHISELMSSCLICCARIWNLELNCDYNQLAYFRKAVLPLGEISFNTGVSILDFPRWEINPDAQSMWI